MKKFQILGLVPGGLGSIQLHYPYLFSSLAKRHKIIGVFYVRLPFFYVGLLFSYVVFRYSRPKMNKWVNFERLNLRALNRGLNYNKRAFLKKTQLCESKIRKIEDKIDLIFQWGAQFRPTIHGEPIKPYFVFNDCPMMLSQRENPYWAPFDSAKERSQWFELETEVYRNAATVFTMSEYARKSLIEDYGIDKSRVVTVYGGPLLEEVPEFEKNYGNKTILFVGRDFERKGGVTLLKALKGVQKQVKNAKLIIVGSKPRVSGRNITVKGFIERKQLLSLYKDASIFVMPSIYEPFGFVFLEAMKYKTPCIGSDRCAMREIIGEGKTGFLVPPKDYQKLADRIVLLLEDENLMREMGENGYLKVEKLFTWDKVADRISTQFESVLN